MDSINIRISKFAVFLDANVIYPLHIRDILLRLAARDTFRVHWSPDVLRENAKVLENVGGLISTKIEILHTQMTQAFPDACVFGYEKMLPDLNLPDKDDIHVVAAALKGRCDLIITSNITDFPETELAALEIEVQHPDLFLTHHLSLERDITLEVIKKIIARMKNPPLTVDEYLVRLNNAGLVNFAAQLKEVDVLLK